MKETKVHPELTSESHPILLGQPGPPSGPSFVPDVSVIMSEGYGYQFTSAIIATLMIVDVVLLVRIRYGDAVITHMTTRPYVAAFCLLGAMQLYILCSVVIMLAKPELMVKVWSHQKLDSFYEKFSASVLTILASLKYFLSICFILLRAFEHKILSFFITYQSKYRVESLDIQKENYQSLEKKFELLHFYGGILMGIPFVVIQILHYFHLSSPYMNLPVFFYLIYALVFALSYYIDAELTLMYKMWKFHRVEFKKHFSQMVRLFVGTVFSMIWLLFVQVFIFYLITCFDALGAEDVAMYDYT